MDAIEVIITEDSLHGKCVKTEKVYLIHHESKDGEDITGLADIASKSSWFLKDNPEFTPNSKQVADILENGRIKIVSLPRVEDIIAMAESKA